jgi:hypothetical protein
VRVSNGGEALLNYGAELQLRLFNDTAPTWSKPPAPPTLHSLCAYTWNWAA